MNCNDCGGFLPHGCDCSPFGGRRSRESDEAFRQFQRDRIEEARKHDAEATKQTLAVGVALPAPLAHLRARAAQHAWQSFEVCPPDDPNAVPVYAAAITSGVPASEPAKRHPLCGKCMTPHICAEDGPGCTPGVQDRFGDADLAPGKHGGTVALMPSGVQEGINNHSGFPNSSCLPSTAGVLGAREAKENDRG